ncbi:MAG: CCA tRNA nucleotidyltransferase [Candidatus Aenigmarchaeota archaeon]|nr:CCA tRNA nucleotidyltransferase [Candidatus Aenigmarchaeota archaeon]
MDNLTKKVLKRIKPTRAEEMLIASIANRLHKIANDLGHDAVVCGSIGKLTWLKGDHDIDLFVLFDKAVSREELERKGLEIGKKMAGILKGKASVKYAEHPYTRIIARIKSDFVIDIVPCYKILPGERIISAVDRSPHHLSHVLKNLKSWQRDEARLLKQFMKGIGAYGSDAKNMGFSGYVCELLIMKYGKFESVLKAAKDWHPAERSNDVMVLIDPVDETRNAAAAVGAENFERFVSSAKRFLKKPSIFFFSAEETPLRGSEARELKARGTIFFGIKIKKPDIIDDILYPQTRRAIKRIEGMLRQNEFYAVRSFECVDDGSMLLVFELETWNMPKIKKMVGPPVFSRMHSKEFLSKYSKPLYGPYIEDNKWVIEKIREFTEARHFFSHILGMEKDRLVASGIPENIASTFRGAVLLHGDAFWKMIAKERVVSACLRKKYLERLS